MYKKQLCVKKIWLIYFNRAMFHLRLKLFSTNRIHKEKEMKPHLIMREMTLSLFTHNLNFIRMTK